ncbi:MAG: hypothetical protein HDT15_00210 [Oscillibacter sp.]|nr:hypothetical protein [Oscillibacter sp.]
MNKFVINEPSEVFISATDIEAANLNEWQRLELHLLDQAAVVIPGEMTVMEVVRTAESLQGLASDLLATIGEACEKCDSCNVELLCNLMKGEIRREVSIPLEVLEEAGADSDCKLACEVDPESGTIHVVEADYRYDLTDVPPSLLDTFRECGICLNDLETKLKEEAVVYGAEEDESFSD